MDKHERVAEEIFPVTPGEAKNERYRKLMTEIRALVADILRREYGEEKPGHIYVRLDFIPVEERVPKDDEAPVMILVAGCSEPVHGLCFYHDEQWCSWDEPWTGWADVTHWAEIPVIERQKDRNVSSGGE